MYVKRYLVATCCLISKPVAGSNIVNPILPTRHVIGTPSPLPYETVLSLLLIIGRCAGHYRNSNTYDARFCTTASQPGAS